MASLLTQKRSTSLAGRGSRLQEINETGYSIPSTSTWGTKTATSYTAAPTPNKFTPAPAPSSVSSAPTPAPAAAPVPSSVASTWTNTGIATNPGSGVTQAPVSAPATAPTGGGTGNPTYDDSAYRAQREAELQAALRALEAEHNLSREALLSDQTEAGDQYRFILAELQRSRQEAIAMAQGNALQRGILRSGIYLGDEAKVNQEFASQEAAAAADRTQKLNAIQTAIADLESTFASGQAATSAGVVQQQLSAMRELANSLAADDALSQRAEGMGYGQGVGGALGAGQTGTVPGAAGVGVAPGLAGARGLGNPFDSTGLPNALEGTDPQGQPLGSPTAQEWMARQRANLMAGPAGGAPVSGKIFENEGPYGGGEFVNLTGGPRVLGTNFTVDPYASNSGNPMGSGSALFGSPKVEVGSFLTSLGPSVLAGLTEQDKANIIAHYGATGIPADAAYNIAASASRIAAQAQDPRYQYR